ncbi:MAG: HAD family hydrolase [Myxococcota bacterium]
MTEIHRGAIPATAPPPAAAAAFLRVEGVLLRRPTLTASAYLAANAQGLGQRLGRLGQLALAAPVALAGPMVTGSGAARATWAGLRGMGEDRLRVLCDEYRERFLEPHVSAVGLDLAKQVRRRGAVLVLISDSLDWLLEPLAERVGADTLVCNRLEIRDGRATGRLLDPVVGGHLAGHWARGFAAERGIDLARSYAYAARASDGLLLSTIGQPCAVHPDPILRRMAQDQHWPVVDG